MGVGILAKRVVLELGSSTNFVYSLRGILCKDSSFWVLSKIHDRLFVIEREV